MYIVHNPGALISEYKNIKHCTSTVHGFCRNDICKSIELS